MKLSVDEVSLSNINDIEEKNIAIRLRGEDISFQASGYAVTIYINEDMADKISFNLSTILQDRYYRRNSNKVPIKNP